MTVEKGHPEGSFRSKVLVVDDDREFAKELESILAQDCDVYIEQATCCALARLRSTKINVAFVDTDLPPFLGPFSEDEGLIFTHLLSEYHMIPVVIVTNSNDPKLLRECARAGAVAIELKQNLNLATLCGLVKRHTRLRETRSRPRTW